MLYGVDICVHFFYCGKGSFLSIYCWFFTEINSWILSHWACFTEYYQHFFPSIQSDENCIYCCYNHFAMLLSFPSCPDPQCLLNDIIRNSEVTPWWNQDRAPSQPGTRATKTNKITVTK
jgi:hypothetical protein